jgi:hypothetical protein
MTHYDYKVIPAPRRLKKIKGIKDTPELFAHTLTDAINEMAREGWEYVRAEQLSAEEPHGWFRRSTEVVQTVMIFRRERADLPGPRLTAVEPESAPARRLPDPGPRDLHPREPERIFAEQLHATTTTRPTAPRPEPRIGETSGAPLRPTPRLGPADKP